MITLRYRLKDLPVSAAERPFKAGDAEFPAGSFLVDVGAGAAALARVKAAVTQLGLTAALLPAAPDVPSHDVDLPRLAVFSTWGSTQDVGWVRHAFDAFEIGYDLIYKEQVRAGRLRDEVRRHRRAEPGPHRQGARLRPRARRARRWRTGSRPSSRTSGCTASRTT